MDLQKDHSMDNYGRDDTMSYSSSSESSLFSSESEEESQPKVSNFIVTIEAYSDGDFKRHFRMDRTTVMDIVDKYKTHTSSFKEQLSAKVDIYMYIWYMSNTLTFRQVGNLFGVAKSTTCNIVKRVVDFIVKLGQDYIKWPSPENMADISSKFQQIKGIPNVLGSIDVTHIQIRAPKESKEEYYNRQNFYSIAVQVVVDADTKFINVCCGEPGSLNDCKILKRSQLYRDCEENFSSHFLPNGFILGGSAYPVLKWLVPPFTESTSLSDSHRRFNQVHSDTREVVENSIRLLKTRFRRIINFTELIDINLLVNIIYSAFVLHNVCLERNDYIDFMLDEDDVDQET